LIIDREVNLLMKENGKVKSAQSLRVTAARLVSDFSLNKVENEKK